MITYGEIMNLGFTEEFVEDSVYLNEHGYDYAIITKKLTKYIYLDWEKETKNCKVVRIDSPKKGNILAELKIKDLQELKKTINFFCEEKNIRL